MFFIRHIAATTLPFMANRMALNYRVGQALGLRRKNHRLLMICTAFAYNIYLAK
jgi:hypothetical protein